MFNRYTKKLGLYIHIPFCASKCLYCDFYSRPNIPESVTDQYVQAIISHLKEYSPRLTQYSVDTVYFGGGTPSFIGAKRLRELLHAVKKYVRVESHAEITLEANPDSADLKSLKVIHRAGFNRISFGVQSANDAELSRLGRIHNFSEACAAVENARKAKFDNISLDLMYGLPDSTVETTLDSLDKLIGLNPEHISTYALKLEEGTPLFRQNPPLPDDDTVADMYLAIVDRLEKAGYKQYEISNFAKPSRESRHNLKYWQLDEYLGLGASAHSYLNGRRFSYISDINKYISAINSGDSLIEVAEDDVNCTSSGEYIMLKLRTAEGIDPDVFFEKFHKPFDEYAKKLEKYIPSGHVIIEDGRYCLTPKGFFVSNSIITELLLYED